MKSRRVVISIEVESAESIRALKEALEVLVSSKMKAKVIQIQANVIKDQKK